MCKKLTRLVKDSEAMKEELAKYRSLYGDVDASLTVEEVGGPGRGGATVQAVSVVTPPFGALVTTVWWFKA